jgi:hypothetical protein
MTYTFILDCVIRSFRGKGRGGDPASPSGEPPKYQRGDYPAWIRARTVLEAAPFRIAFIAWLRDMHLGDTPLT